MTRKTQGPAGRHGVARAAGVAAAAVLLLCLWAAGAVAAAPGDVVWRDLAQRRPGGDDAYTALAVSPSGQVCAVGSTAASPGAPPDVLVRTYRSDGSLRWRRVWTWPGGRADAAAAVVRAPHGGYVIAGSSGPYWLLLRYTSGGYLQWVRRGRGSFAQCALDALAVDDAGNVYAAGSATAAGGSSRLFLLKCSAAGAVRWRRSYGTDAGAASASDVVFGAGSVYVAGQAATGPGTSAAVLAAYSAAGVRRWVRAYAAPGAVSAQATAVAWVSGPAIAGWSTTAGGADDGFVARYTVGGTQRWAASYDAADATADRFRDLAAGADGRVCAAGEVVTAGGAQALTVCFDAAGSPLWSLLGPGTQGFAACRFADGFASVAGTASFAAARVTAAGAAAWESTDTPGGYVGFAPAAVQAAGSAYLYAAGSATDAGGARASLLVRYRP